MYLISLKAGREKTALLSIYTDNIVWKQFPHLSIGRIKCQCSKICFTSFISLPSNRSFVGTPFVSCLHHDKVTLAK